MFSPMEWIRGPTVGHGTSAIVSLATAIPSGKLFAVKSAELSRSSLLQKEQLLLSQLNCPQVVEYMGFDITCENGKPTYNLCMEYVPGGSLADAIKKHGGWLEESLIRLYTHQIVLGLNYLHVNGLVHCDIKGSNILVGENGLKIADLGCARYVEEVAGYGDAARSTFAGTPVFMAPEVARGEEQGFPADVWAVGCTIIEMATGSNPWPEVDDPVSALYRIGFSEETPEFPSFLSDKAKDFLSKCLRRDSKERWTAKQLLQHPFLDDLEPYSKEAEEFRMNSPISVLDQSFWDSLEVSENSRNSAHIGSSLNSPAARIRRLSAGTLLSSVSSVPNWTWDEDWVTVRSNDIEEIEMVSDQSCNFSPADETLDSTELVMVSISHEEGLESSVFNEDLLLEYSGHNISTISTYSSRVCIVMACILLKMVLYSEISILRQIMRIFVFINFAFSLLTLKASKIFLLHALTGRI